MDIENITIIKTLPGDEKHKFFTDFPKTIYDPLCHRFIIGHDPMEKNLEGCYLFYYKGKAFGRFALYENPDLLYHGKSAASIGCYECINNDKLSKTLISRAIDIVKNKKYTWLLGPMEGSTWHNYRFSHNNSTAFFLEPYHHNYYNQQFLNNGFVEIAKYYSHLVDDVDKDLAEFYVLKSKYEKNGLTFRNIDMSNFKCELKKLGRISIEGFRNNFLFTKISIDEFVSLYEKIQKYIDPSLIWIAEDKSGKIQALVFCIKDFFDPLGKTMILKSIVRSNEDSVKGIGYCLGLKTFEMAQKGGYNKVVHAMMMSDNSSVQISERFEGDSYKDYSLYGYKL